MTERYEGDLEVEANEKLLPSGDVSVDVDAIEEREDEAKQRPSTKKARRTIEVPKSKWKRISTLSIIAFFGGLFLLGYLASYALVSLTRYGHTQKQVNVILMISDGFGPASESLARSFVQFLHASDHPSAQTGGRWSFDAGFHGKHGLGRGGLGVLPLDQALVGQSRTRSSNSLISDSAAGATAFSCARKTYNGAVAVDPETKDPCGTILEAAKHQGYLTAIVATSRIMHATPASFYAHVVDRDMESEIATMLLATHPLSGQVDLAFGGGRCFFLRNSSEGSCRKDDRDIIAEAAKIGKTRLNLISTRNEFDNLPTTASSLGTVGLFNLDHMNYEIDRLSQTSHVQEPSLLNMTEKALQILSDAAAKTSAHGFFAMIEGSRIDMAGHSNDPGAHVYDILAYQETFQFVRQFAEEQTRKGWPTLVISVADHETGGLSLAKQLDQEIYPEYLWYPDVLANTTSSTFRLATEMAAHMPLSDNEVREIVQAGLGVYDLDSAEVRRIQEESNLWRLDKVLATILSDRAQLGWSTHGHSGVDVSLYATGYRSEELRGNVDNTDIGLFIANVLQLDLNATTNMLLRNSKAWHKKDMPASINTVGIQHFHGHDSGSHGQQEHLYLGSTD